MVTAEELTIAIRSEGVSETRDDLEGMERSMEDTADAASDSAEDLEAFTQRIKGAMTAAAVGVAVAVGSLLSNIPIVGELASGLGAIFDALSLQVDQLSRDMGGGGLVDVLFDIADVINSADGAAGDLVGALTVLGTIVAGAAAGVAAFAVKTMGFVGAASALWGALQTVGTVIAGVVAGISATTAAVALAIAAIVGFVAAYLTNWRGVRDKTNRIVGQIIDFVVGGFMSLGTKALNAVTDFAADVRTFFSNLGSDISDWASDLAADAREWGVNILTRFIGGIESMLGAVRQVLDDIPFIDQILRLFDRLSNAISDLDLSGNVSAELGASLSGNGGGGGTRGGGGGSSGRPTFGGQTSGGMTIDGRQISESTGRYRSDPSRRRGL